MMEYPLSATFGLSMSSRASAVIARAFAIDFFASEGLATLTFFGDFILGEVGLLGTAGFVAGSLESG